jgi:hypothetical protein
MGFVIRVILAQICTEFFNSEHALAFRTFFDQLKQDGILASDRLPFDCMAWFAAAPPSFLRSWIDFLMDAESIDKNLPV